MENSFYSPYSNITFLSLTEDLNNLINETTLTTKSN